MNNNRIFNNRANNMIPIKINNQKIPYIHLLKVYSQMMININNILISIIKQ